jgi:adenylyltransferase/sulfurtransferase
MDNTFSLSGAVWKEICQHAEDEFPDECCGVLLSNGTIDRVQRLRNIQNELHARDPKTHPRTAAIAYNMDVKVLDALLLEASKIGFALKAIYHSHPNHGAYFSTEDHDAATPFGDPTYPDAVQIVVSIYDQVIKEIAAFAWSDDRQNFVEVFRSTYPG